IGGNSSFPRSCVGMPYWPLCGRISPARRDAERRGLHSHAGAWERGRFASFGGKTPLFRYPCFGIDGRGDLEHNFVTGRHQESLSPTRALAVGKEASGMSTMRQDPSQRPGPMGWSTVSAGGSPERESGNVLSVIVPAKNESASLPQLVDEI